MARHSVNPEHALVAATLGFTTVEIIKLWRDSAPSLDDVRKAPNDDLATMQSLMDANYLGAGLAIMIGGMTSYLAESWIPVILSTASVAYIAWWYRMVLRSDHIIMMKDNENG